MSAHQTHPQMDPGIAHGQTFFAALGAWSDLIYLVKMLAFGGHASTLVAEDVEQ